MIPQASLAGEDPKTQKMEEICVAPERGRSRKKSPMVGGPGSGGGEMDNPFWGKQCLLRMFKSFVFV